MSGELQKYQGTFDEFKDKVQNLPNVTNALDKIANAYTAMPSLFRALTAIDKSGVFAIVDKILTENKAKRTQNNILYAIYELVKIVHLLSKELTEIEDLYKKEQVAELTYIYLERCKETRQQEKIKYFRNIWFNSITDADRAFDEKAYVFDLVGSLRIEQILVLKYVHEKQANTKAKDRIAVEVKNIAKALDMENEHVQQICISLQGMGLLHTGLGPRREQGPNMFSMTEYVKLMGDYIKAPEIS